MRSSTVFFGSFALLASVFAAVSTHSQRFDPSAAWPLCGRIAENPPENWDPAVHGCPADRWGNPDFADLPLSSTFGPRQKASEDFRFDYHRGIDIPASEGTPVFAVAAGVVTKAGEVSGYSDPMIQVRHYRPSFWGSCPDGQGCYHSNYLHLSSWVVSQDQEVEKGQLLGATGTGESGFAHLHFEVRDAPSEEPYSAWSRDTVHPLRLLPYSNQGMAVAEITIDDVSAGEDFLRVAVSVSLPSSESDLIRVEIFVYEIQEDDSLVPVAQPGSSPDPQGYNLHPPWFDMEVFDFQYTHKDGGAFPWEEFGVGGTAECPFAGVHTPEYDPSVHLDDQDPMDPKKGWFNGVSMAPAPHSADSTAYSLSLRFDELAGTADPEKLYIKVEAVDLSGSRRSVSRRGTEKTPPGDADCDDEVDLADAVLLMRTLAFSPQPRFVCTEADVNGDYRLGAEEVVFALRASGNP